jgi:hypothetical protein
VLTVSLAGTISPQQVKSICWTSDCGLAASFAWYSASSYFYLASSCSA